MNKTLLTTLAIFAIVLFSGCVSNELSGMASVANSDDFVSISLNNVSEEAEFYEYESDGATIRFFVVMASDGGVKTAFDACDVCNYAKKGYIQDGSNMVCNNCGNKYPIVGLGTENKSPGGCWPSYLPNEIVNEEVLLKKSDLKKGVGLFS